MSVQDNPVHLKLLGDVSVTQGDTSIPLKKKNLALIAYLARHSEPISRNELALLLWPDRALKNRQNGLRMLLFRMPDQIKSCLDIKDKTVRFRHEDVQFDIQQFEETINFAEQVNQDEHTLKNTALELTEKAISLYRGLFLEDFYLDGIETFMDWLVQERQILQRRAFIHGSRLLAHYVNLPDIGRAIISTQELLRIAPFDEDANLALMKLWADHGNNELAIQHFQDFQKRLSTRLNTTPGRKIRTYYRQLINAELVPEERRLRPADFKLLLVKKRRPSAKHHDLKFQPVPQSLTKLFGREPFLAKLHQDILRSNNRLISLVGMGGIGKTQLAIALAHRVENGFNDGVLYIPLREVKRASLLENIDAEGESGQDVGEVIAEQLARESLVALKVQPSQDVAPFDQLIENIGRRELLIIYDNMDHLIEGAPFFTRLLHAAAEVTVLVTSRIRLGEDHERIISVPRLEASSSSPKGEQSEADPLLRSGAIQLFLDRAKRLAVPLSLGDDELNQIQNICNLVGGVPLAIEQAASWVIHYSLGEIIQEIEENYRFLEKLSLPENDPHRSMRSVFERSYQLLSIAERRALQGFTFFQNEFSRDAALAVSGEPISILISLLNHSLLQQEKAGWYNLHPLIAQFLTEKVATDPLFDTPRFKERYTTYFLDILAGSKANRFEMEEWEVVQTERIKEDLLQAWRWGGETEAYDDLDRCVNRLGSYFSSTGNFASGVKTFEWVVNLLGSPDFAPRSPILTAGKNNVADGPTVMGKAALIPKLLLWAGYFSAELFRFDQAEQHLSKALDLVDEEADPGTAMQVRVVLGRIFKDQGRIDSLAEKLEEARRIAEQLPEPYYHQQIEHLASSYFLKMADYPKAVHHARLALHFSEDSIFTRLSNAYFLSIMLAWDGEVEQGLQLTEDLLNEIDESPHVAFAITTIKFLRGTFLTWLGRYREGIEQFTALIDPYRKLGIGPESLIYTFSCIIDAEIIVAESNKERLAEINLEGLAEDMLELGEGQNLPHSMLLPLAAAAATYAFSNRWYEADRHYRQMINRFESLENKESYHYFPSTLVLIAYYLLLKGETQTLGAAIAYLQQVRQNPTLKTLLKQLLEKFEEVAGKPYAAEEPPQNQAEMIQLLIDRVH